jgi:hypothetical protein
MDTIFSGYVKFPADEEVDLATLDRLYRLLGSVEEVEKAFNIEFSCGDGKYISDMEDDSSELDKYDGNVCLSSPPRESNDGKEFELGKDYLFEIMRKGDSEPYEWRFYIDEKETTRRIGRLK